MAGPSVKASSPWRISFPQLPKCTLRPPILRINLLRALFYLLPNLIRRYVSEMELFFKTLILEVTPIGLLFLSS